jgi:hypothetical protein
MKHLLQLLLLLIVMAVHANAQPATDTGFATQKLYIDSITQATDSNKALTNNLFTGSLMWGPFNANIFYMVGNPVTDKEEYFFKEGNAGKKIFYYNKNKLVKIVDNGTAYYYYTNVLYDKNGRPVKEFISGELVFFSQESHRMMLSLIQ